MKRDEPNCPVKKIEEMDTEQFEKITEMLSAVSNKARIAILSLMMREGELCTCDLQAALKIPQSTVTIHLKNLYNAGFLKKREKWRYTYYSINSEHAKLVEDILNCKARMDQTKTQVPSLIKA